MDGEKSVMELHDELGRLLAESEALRNFRCIDCGAFAMLLRCPTCAANLKRGPQ